MTFVVPRESKELIPLTITVGGVAVTDYQTALVVDGERPTTWAAAAVVDTDTGIMLPGNLAAGRWRIFVKVTDTPEIPVIDMGTIQLT